MAGTFLGKYDTTAANNSATGTGAVSVAEGMLPSNINNAFRSVMADIRQHYNEAEWIEYGDGAGTYTATYASGTSFTIDGTDVTSIYHAGRRVKVVASTPGTIYGTVSSTSFSTNTTVNVTWDSSSLSNEAITSVHIGVLSKTNNSIPTGISATKIADGTISDTEFQYLNGVSSAIQTQLDAKQATITGSATTIDTESLTANRAVISNGSQKIAVSDVTDTELGYLDGVTSAVQTQIDSKQATITGGATTITSSNLTASRALQSNGSGKVEVSDVTTTELGYLDGVTSAIQTQLDAKQTSDAQLTDIAGLTPTDSNFIVGDGSNFVTESGATARTSLGLGSIATQAANNVSISGGSVTGLGAPSGTSDAATKNYVDQAIAGLRTRIIAEVATTANVNLAADLQNGDTIDGVTLVTGDRVLVKDQSTGSQNGLYTVVSSGTASRDTEFDTIAELSGQMVVVNQGTTNDNKIFLCTTNNTATLDSDTITFTVITPANVGTVTSVGVADAGSSEFTVANSPITSSGNITLAVNSIANTKITGLGTASTKTVGTSANNVVQLDGSAKLPAVDGSQLTNIDAASAGFAIAMAIAL
nr:prophage MuMc02 [uncultured Mediterranean phage uvMED]